MEELVAASIPKKEGSLLDSGFCVASLRNAAAFDKMLEWRPRETFFGDMTNWMKSFENPMTDLLNAAWEAMMNHPVTTLAVGFALATVGSTRIAWCLWIQRRRDRKENRALQAACEDQRNREGGLVQELERIKAECGGLAARVELFEQVDVLETRREAAIAHVAFRMLVSSYPEWAPVLCGVMQQARRYLAEGGEGIGLAEGASGATPGRTAEDAARWETVMAD
jgi:hypothetical protein